MTKAVGDDESMYKSLQEVVHLFELAQTSVFKLMSSVSWTLVEVSHALFSFRTDIPSRIPYLNSSVTLSTPSSSKSTTLTSSVVLAVLTPPLLAAQNAA